MKRDTKAGFTLMEVLVAVAILAVMSTGLIKLATESARHTQFLTDKTIATIVASNALNDWQLQHKFKATPPSLQNVPMGGRTWRVTMQAEKTPLPSLRKLVVTVSLPSDAKERPTWIQVTQMTGYEGLY